MVQGRSAGSKSETLSPADSKEVIAGFGIGLVTEKKDGAAICKDLRDLFLRIITLIVIDELVPVILVCIVDEVFRKGCLPVIHLIDKIGKAGIEEFQTA